MTLKTKLIRFTHSETSSRLYSSAIESAWCSMNLPSTRGHSHGHIPQFLYSFKCTGFISGQRELANREGWTVKYMY